MGTATEKAFHEAFNLFTNRVGPSTFPLGSHMLYGLRFAKRDNPATIHVGLYK